MTSRNIFATCATIVGTLSTLHGAITWNAAADFHNNETSATELSNPNAQVPVWSYGYRESFASATITLFGTGQHSNAINTNVKFQGWVTGASVIVGTNVSAGLDNGLNPGQMLVHPGSLASNPTYNVVRFTAPTAGSYNIAASWFAVSTTTGTGLDGVDTHVVVNGASIYDALAAPGATKTTGTLNVNLSAGGFVDFVVGPGASGNNTNDSTIFDANITLVPEPSSTLLLLGALPLCFVRRRKAAN
ncbi:MAG: PEP-CTERM sorting domain-containing protein [Verrucomicrobiaceae bacterium]|nr:MAG: PEP-CTERM sorting domain-containing protein [Verrucomicrobiaceae bacterium]